MSLESRDISDGGGEEKGERREKEREERETRSAVISRGVDSFARCD